MQYDTLGYDKIRRYSKYELVNMYTAEGKSSVEAEVLASVLAREMNKLRCKERYSWKRRWDHEVPGLEEGLVEVIMANLMTGSSGSSNIGDFRAKPDISGKKKGVKNAKKDGKRVKGRSKKEVSKR